MPTRICTICARGGSKGLKNKNVLKFIDKPLIANTISIARATGLFDCIAVSSDCDNILETAKIHGADYAVKRPAHLASDTAAKLPAIQHCALTIQETVNKQFDTIVDISVTAPLIQAEDIIGAVKLLESSNAINAISGVLTHHSPYFSMVEKNETGFFGLVKKQGNILRRQDCPPCYNLNGAIYVWSADYFYDLQEVITSKTLIYEMPPERSIDIDSALDFEIAQFIYQKNKTAMV